MRSSDVIAAALPAPLQDLRLQTIVPTPIDRSMAVTFRYAPEDQHHGELSAVGSFGGFSGQASAWFNADDLSAFALEASAYPLTVGKPVRLAGGYWIEGGGDLAETHLSVSVEPLGVRGELQASIRLATPAGNERNWDLPQSVTLRFKLSYTDLHRFTSEFREMLAGKQVQATMRSNEPDRDR